MLLCHFDPSRSLIRDANNAPHTLLFCLFFALAPAKSFVSPTSRKAARKCFVSPTYAKTGGWGYLQMCSPITLLFSVTMLTSQLSEIVGAPTISFLYATKMLHEQQSGGEIGEFLLWGAGYVGHECPTP